MKAPTINYNSPDDKIHSMSIPQLTNFKIDLGEEMEDFVINESKLKDFDYLRITKEKDIDNPPPTVTINGAAVASPGNITGISAASKAGKTGLRGVIVAGAISLTGLIDGFEALAVLPNSKGFAVIDLDTEQSEADQQYLVNTILKRAYLEKTPEYYRSYNIRQLNINDYKIVTDKICELASKEFGGIHMIVIDGGADYIKSVNDEALANDIVQYFMKLAIKYKCPVIVIIHLNPNSDKERGHFGSEIQRKCYGLLNITKLGPCSTLTPKILRKAGNDDVPPIHFGFNKEKGYHDQIEDVNKEKKSGEEYRMKMEIIVCSFFIEKKSYSYKEAISVIMQGTSKKMTTAKAMFNDMQGFDFIQKGEDKSYTRII